jgi:hypothetical protein
MGEGKIGRLREIWLILMAVYVGFSSLVLLSATILEYSPVLLLSLTLNLVVFLASIVSKRNKIQLLSWIWLGANLILSQVVLSVWSSYLTTTLLVLGVYLGGELSNFLEFLYPMRAWDSDVDLEQYRRSWELFKRHAKSMLFFIALAEVLALAAVSLAYSIALPSNPTLAVAIAVSLSLILTALISFEWHSK